MHRAAIFISTEGLQLAGVEGSDRRETGGRRVSFARALLALVPLVVIIPVMFLIIMAVVTQGQGISITDTDGLDADTEGSFLIIQGDVTVQSNLVFDLEDVSVSVDLVDPETGSNVGILEEGGIRLPSGTPAVIHLDSKVFVPTLYLLVSELVSREGAALDLDIHVSGRYLGGLMCAEVVASVEVPVAAQGERIVWNSTTDGTGVSVDVAGLADWLVPDPGESLFGSPNASLSIAVIPSEGAVSIHIVSDRGLSDTLDILSRDAAEGLVVMSDESGRTSEVSADQMGTVRSIIGILEGLAG